MGKIQSLRRLAVKLEMSGTATAIENTKLYKGSYAFVWLQAYVPVTQNRADDTVPLCTVHGLITDTLGVRRRMGASRYNMMYADTVNIGGFEYMRFERMMPKPLTDEVGDLELVFNYSEITEMQAGENPPPPKLSSRLVSSIFHTRVEEGGESDDDIDVALKDQEIAQISKNKNDIALLQSDVEDLELADIALGERIDDTEDDIGILDGKVTDLQNDKIDKTEKGEPNGVAPLNEVGELDGVFIKKGQAGGVASLDANGKVPANQLDIPGTLEYQGTWNAATNTPNLDTVAKKGYYYKVDTPGEQYGKSWDIGDWIISNGEWWQKIDNSDVDAFTKEQSDTRYIQRTKQAVNPNGDTVATRTPTGQVKGANAEEPDDLVNKAQLDVFRNRMQSASDNVDYAITMAIQATGIAEDAKKQSSEASSKSDDAVSKSEDAKEQSGNAIEIAQGADENARQASERAKSVDNKIKNAAENSDFSVSMVMMLLAELEDIKQRLTALENK